MSSSLGVYYEDSFLLIINKPAGLSSESQFLDEKTLVDFLRSDFGIKLERGGLVHRLDKDTSGIMIVAKTKEALDFLQQQFKSRKVKKEYVGLVHGFLRTGGRIEIGIGRNPSRGDKFLAGVSKLSREAVTEYESVKLLSLEHLGGVFKDFSKIELKRLQNMGYRQYTLVTLRPLTGRTHQIRVHLKCINHPLVGDQKYGGRKFLRLDRMWCPRQFLHAKMIGFKHPMSRNWMEFASPLPSDLAVVLNLLVEVG